MNVDIPTLVNQLKIARKFYYDGRPIMDDGSFDTLENKLREIDPTNDYFSTVGAPPARGEKVKHTIPMGSLDQVSTEDEISKWIKTGAGQIIGTDKLDGNSIALYYGIDGDFECAVTRGDGIEGLDITRHLRRMFTKDRPNGRPIPQILPINGPVVVRAEAIFRKDLFKDLVKGYKNPRNYVGGQLNRTLADQTFIDYVDIVAFDMDCGRNKVQMLDWLNNFGFKVVPFYTIQKIDLEELTRILEKRKAISKFELDGIVLDFDDSNVRNQLGFENLNPRYSVKFKINQNFVETEVIDVIWAPSKDGFLKPRVNFEPIDLAGVTISFATGFNAKYILDNKIGPGAVIKVTRSGDVVPKIEEIISSAKEAAMPSDYENTCYWTETGTDLVLYEKPDESYVKEIVEFFKGIDAPILKMGNVAALYDAGLTTISDIIKASEDDLVVILGENGIKAHLGLKEKLTNIDEYVLAGSLPFFGRGVGKRKMKVLAELHGDLTKLTYDKVMETPGFDEKTAVKVANAVPFYIDFLNDLSYYVSVKKFEKVEGDLSNVFVCFTGIRDKALEQVIESRGGKVLSSASKQMTHLVAKDINGTSGKLKKARDAGVRVISIEEARNLWLDT